MLKYPYPLSHSEYHEIGGDSDALLSFIPPIAKTTTLAQLWYGSYPNQHSYITINKRKLTLQQHLHQQSAELLNPSEQRELDVLLKIIAYQSPQPLHVHPNQAQAIEGFDRESLAQTDFSKRFFHDRKAKHELLYALDGGLSVLAGFQAYQDIAQNIHGLGISSLLREADAFIQNPCADELEQLFCKLLSHNHKYQTTLARQINEAALLQAEFDPLYEHIVTLANHHSDSTLLIPLFLQHHQLDEGQLLYIEPQTPHQILQGLALEVSNASHNPLPLTSQTMPLAQSQQWIDFSKICINQTQRDDKNPDVALPLAPFEVQIVNLENAFFINGKNRALILLTLKGKAHLNAAPGNRYRNQLPLENLALRKGEALFLPANAGGYELTGRGRFALAWAKL